MEVRWIQRVFCACVVQLCLFPSWITGSDHNKEPMWSSSFEGMATVQLLACQKPVENDFSLIQLKDQNATVLAAWVKHTKGCEAKGSYFAACVYEEEQSVVTVKVVLTDVQYGHSGLYYCSTMYVSGSGPSWVHHNITVSNEVTRTQALSTTPAGNHVPPQTGQSISTQEDPLFPASVVIVILTLLIALVTIACVLGVFYFRGRRKKRKSRDCDAISVRSAMTDKSFYTVGPLGGRGLMEGVGTGRMVRQYSNTPPPPPDMMVADVAGTKRVVMQYQRPSDSVPSASTMAFSDRGYMSGSSVHYQEPWGRPLDDPEILGKLATLKSHSRGVVRIPDFDAASCSSPPLSPPPPPPPPSAPPTQETSSSALEESA